MAAGCRDSFPNVVPPLDVLYFPVGLAVRQRSADARRPVRARRSSRSSTPTSTSATTSRPAAPSWSIDPDLSQDTALGGQMDGPRHPVRDRQLRGRGRDGRRRLPARAGPTARPRCPQLTADPSVAVGGPSWSSRRAPAQTLYRVSMGADGSLECGDGCPFSLPIDRLDPYGVSIGLQPQARAARRRTPSSPTSLAANNLGWLTRVDLLADESGRPRPGLRRDLRLDLRPHETISSS